MSLTSNEDIADSDIESWTRDDLDPHRSASQNPNTLLGIGIALGLVIILLIASLENLILFLFPDIEGHLVHEVHATVMDGVIISIVALFGLFARHSLIKEKSMAKLYQNISTKLKLAIDSLPHPFIVVAVSDYSIVLANRAAEIDRNGSEVTCYRVLFDLGSPCDDERHDCPLRLAHKLKESVFTERTRRKPDGTIEYLEIHAHPILSRENQVHSVILNVVNITEKRSAEKSLFAATERALLYLDLLGHDTAQHLQAVLGYIEIANSEIQNPETAMMLAYAANSVERCGQMISKIRATESMMNSPLMQQDLIAALENCVAQLNDPINGISIVANYPTTDMSIMADEFIERLFLNLLENTIDHNPKEEKNTSIHFKELDDWYKIFIRDDGPGLGEANGDILLDVSKRFGGVGILQSKHIVEKYGGDISIRNMMSDEEILGTEVEVTLPKIKN